MCPIPLSTTLTVLKYFLSVGDSTTDDRYNVLTWPGESVVPHILPYSDILRQVLVRVFTTLPSATVPSMLLMVDEYGRAGFGRSLILSKKLLNESLSAQTWRNVRDNNDGVEDLCMFILCECVCR